MFSGIRRRNEGIRALRRAPPSASCEPGWKKRCRSRNRAVSPPPNTRFDAGRSQFRDRNLGVFRPQRVDRAYRRSSPPVRSRRGCFRGFGVEMKVSSATSRIEHERRAGMERADASKPSVEHSKPRRRRKRIAPRWGARTSNPVRRVPRVWWVRLPPSSANIFFRAMPARCRSLGMTTLCLRRISLRVSSTHRSIGRCDVGQGASALSGVMPWEDIPSRSR